MRISLYTVFQALIYIKKYTTGNLYVDSVIHIFGVNIFRVCIGFIWNNATYIKPNFYRTIF